jgi:hypothetical protein
MKLIRLITVWWDSSVSTGTGLEGQGPIPGGVRGSFILHSVQLCSGAHQSPAQEVKLTTHLHSLPRSRMVELYLHSPYIFILWLIN